jgi:hypothetical protein
VGEVNNVDTNHSGTSLETNDARLKLSPPCPHTLQQPKWEKCLLKHFIVATMPNLKLLEILISMQTMDTGIVLSMKGLLDCRATGEFINSNYIKQNKLAIRKLSKPILVYNLNGSQNKAGSILEVWECVL